MQRVGVALRMSCSVEEVAMSTSCGVGEFSVDELKCWGVAIMGDFQHWGSCTVHGHGVGRLRCCTVAELGSCNMREVRCELSHGLGVKVFGNSGVGCLQCGMVSV